MVVTRGEGVGERAKRGKGAHPVHGVRRRLGFRWRAHESVQMSYSEVLHLKFDGCHFTPINLKAY